MPSPSKCLGCGAIKQTSNNNLVGYVKDLSHDYCLECFSLANYRKTNKHFKPDTYDSILPNSLILIITSPFFLDQLTNLPITKIQKNAKYVYIINQIDLLEKHTNLDYLDKQIKKKFNEYHTPYDNIVYMSALNNAHINNLKQLINSYREENVYLFGLQNSGKTTIFKALTNNTAALNINKAGLTQDVIMERLENKTIYDLPGVYTKGFLNDFFEYEKYNKFLPYKTLKPKIYQLKNTNKLVINDFLEVSVNSQEKVSLVFYLSDHNNITKYNINNTNNYLNEDYSYVTKTFKVGDKKQITIADFLIVLTKGNFSITIKTIKDLKVTIMESLLK